jgi:LacI family transcriptional regulator
VDTIRTRNQQTAERLAEHLIGHGHRRFAFLGDPAGSPDVAGRYAGLAKALAGHGIAAPVPVPCDLDLDSGREAAAELLRHPPDAIVGANDEVALGAHLAAEEAGVSIPGDVAVTGWDDLMAARFAGLTTVAQPMRLLGATAARWLHERITERENNDRPVPARRRILPTQLVVRRSCGAHPEETR